MLIYRLIESKKANSLIDTFIYQDSYIFYYSNLTKEYRFTDSKKWIENFNRAKTLKTKKISDFKSEDIQSMVDIGMKINNSGKMLPISNQKYIVLFKLLMSTV